MRLILKKLQSGAANRAFVEEVAVLYERGIIIKLGRVSVKSFCQSFEAECIL